MNWKKLFYTTLVLSFGLTMTYFSIGIESLNTWGGWNSVVLIFIIGLPSFTYFMNLFHESQNNLFRTQTPTSHQQSVYNSMLNQLATDPNNRELYEGTQEAGNSYYQNSALKSDYDPLEKVQADITNKINSYKKSA